MNYQSKNPEVRKLLDRPRVEEWIEFEMEHIAKQVRGADHDWGTEEMQKEMEHQLFVFRYDLWEQDVKDGGHEIERMLSELARRLPVKYHKYLHRNLTSSNVIDSCNHRRWDKLLTTLDDSLKGYNQALEKIKCQEPQDCVGMTHGRRAHRTKLGYRVCSVGGWFDLWYDNHIIRDNLKDVTGGPTGNTAHRQAVRRSDYWPIWVHTMQVCAGMEQLATDYRFYCSDLSEAVGVKGTLASGIATTSSAMPGKVNPTVFERVCSVGYMVRTMCAAQMLAPPKWLDADLVHSALERETIDRIWDHTFWLVEEMTWLVSTTKLEVTRKPEIDTSFDALQRYQDSGLEYSAARAAASKFPCG